MLFNSFSFAIFLLMVLVISAVLRRINKNSELWFLVIASAYFYGQWNWSYLILIYITIVCDYILGQKYFRSDKPEKFLYISLTVNLGILGIFKYLNFLINSSNTLIETVGFSYAIPGVELLLPVGISFYTFQSLSYMIDIHRGGLKPRQKFVDYALFVSFFPQLVAGPIVRASEFFKQLDEKRNFSFTRAQTGIFIITLGLVKKVVFADNLALIVDPVFNSPETVSGFQTLIAVYAFAFQIYFDFSGYTDIAIGVALLLGFQFPKNFNHPYVAISIQDFWRRWHMTLSRWLRDYLYISLGGNRNGTWKTQRNLFLTMFLGGLWHGASWNFAIWGMLHGVYLAIERKISNYHWLSWNLENKAVRFIKWLMIFNLICFAWIFFRADDMYQSMQILKNIMNIAEGIRFKNIFNMSFLLVISLIIIHKLSFNFNFSERCSNMKTFEFVFWQTTFILMLILFGAKEAESFMYFQF